MKKSGGIIALIGGIFGTGPQQFHLMEFFMSLI